MKTGKNRIKSALVSDFRAGYSEKFQKTSVFCSRKTSSKVIFASLVAIFSFTVGYSAGRVFAPVSTTSAISSGDIEIGVSSIEVENTVKSTKSSIEKAEELALKSEADIPKPVYSLEIPSIGLYTNVIPTYVNESNDIIVPASGVGALSSYKGRYFNLLVGHRANVFKGLGSVNFGDVINYYGESYQVTSIYQQTIANVDMYSLTSNSSDLKLITCAGDNNSERLIIIARRI